MASDAPSNRLPKTAKLGILTLAVMNIVSVVSLRGMPAEAEYGLSSVFYYLFAAIAFLVPVSLVAAELATGWPERGGVFRWVGEAFGPRLALVAMFMLWLEVTVWFPTGLTFAAVSLAFVRPEQSVDQALAGNKLFVLVVVLAIYWIATIVTFRGVGAFARLAKWGGIIGTLVPAAILIILGFAYLIGGGHVQIALDARELIPDFSKFSNLVLAASIFLFYAGMEMNAIHVKDVRDAPRNYPKAILIAAVGTVTIFVLGTLAIAFVIPHAKINLTQSLLIAYRDMFRWAGLSWLAPIIAVALAVGVLASVVSWVAGPSTGFLEVGRAGYLPRWWQHTNRRGMAKHILLVQGGLVTLLSIMFVVLPSVQAAYQILSQLTVILYLVMYMLMFAAAIYLRYSQPNRPRPYRIPFGDTGMWVVGGVGFLGALLAFVLSFVPPDQIKVGSKGLYIGLLVGLSAVFIAIPFIVYAIRKPHWRDPASEFAPFTWEAERGHPGIPTASSTPTAELPYGARPAPAGT